VFAHLHDWLHLLLRWTHVLAGIMWIGDSFLFMWMDRTLVAPDPPREGVTGELFMVHGGGYYQLERRVFLPGKMPPVLHWFMWEATTTWVSGFLLLLVVYYLGGGALLVDAGSPLSFAAAAAVGIGTLVVAWLVYDALWKSPLGKSTPVAGGVSLVLFAALAWGLTRVLSGRAAFLHAGAALGTIMVANVWVRILPAQRRMLAAVRRGETFDPAPGLAAKERSTHNSYMTLPVLFTMVSNHFPATYGSPWAWLVLVLLALSGAAVRHFMLVRTAKNAGLLAAATACVIACVVLTSPEPLFATRAPQAAAPAIPKTPIDPATVGSITGTVRVGGPAPVRAPLSLASDCAPLHKEPVLSETVVAENGLLQNALVFISKGAEGWEAPPAQGDVLVDQQGCVYRPHVLGARVGQAIAIRNSDPVLHNVHALAKTNSGFNVSMPTKGEVATKRFTKPEIVALKCDVHPWMGARIGVFDHPWFSVTGADGAFTLAGVPPGHYTLTAWHETLGERSAEVTVPAKGSVETSFVIGVPVKGDK
jgi:uncharacterized membrane protein